MMITLLYFEKLNQIKNIFFILHFYFPEFEVFEGSVDDLPVLLVLKSFETELVE